MRSPHETQTNAPPRRMGSAPGWIAAAALAIHAALVLNTARVQSTTMDEVVYAAAGYARLTAGAGDPNPEHPPLMKLLLGTAWLGSGIVVPPPRDSVHPDPFQIGYHVLYDVPERAAGLLMRARIVPLVLSLLCGVAVFLVARRSFGPAAGAFAALLYALDPLGQAHAGLATLDMGLTAAAFVAMAAVLPALERGRYGWVLAAGVATGVALGVKATAVVLLPASVAVALAPAMAGGAGQRSALARRLLRLGTVLGIAGAVGCIACLPDGPSAWVRAWILQVEHARRGHEAFAAGAYSSRGWWWYYPFVWLIKTPIPLLFASAAGVLMLTRRFRAEPAVSTTVTAFPLLILAVALASPLALGARQLLPAVPFLAVAGGAALARAWRTRVGKSVSVVLVGWLAVGTLMVQPHSLAYANEAAGGPRRLHRLLADSNVDWGQAVPALAEEVARLPVRTLWFDYFGNALPAAHGLSAYRRIGGPGHGPDARADGIRPDGRELLAVSTTLLLDVYGTDRGAHAWLRERDIMALPGYSIALFDITGDAEAYRRLANTAERVGDVQSAAEAWARALEHGGPDSRVYAGISRVYLTVGAPAEAAQACAQAMALSPGLDPRACREVPRDGR